MSIVLSPYLLTRWTPSFLSSRLFWLDSVNSSLTVDSNNRVLQWRDYTNNNIIGSQSNINNCPTFLNNGIKNKPSLFFNGNSNFLSTSVTHLTPCFIASVVTTVSTSGVARGYFSRGNKTISLGEIRSSPPALSAYALWKPNIDRGAYINNTAIKDKPSIVLAKATDMNALTWDIWVNGSNLNRVQEYLSPASGSSVWKIGHSTSGEYWHGYIGELLFFNQVLSDIDRQKLEGYLAHKWDLTSNLPFNHPYKNNYPVI